MPFTTKDWRDSPGDLTTPITAAALENLESRTTAGIPYENVLWHGAVGNDTGNQAPAIQAAIDACEATGGTVYIPRGTYRMAGSLELHANISLIGEGPGASVLSWPTSLGADTWALTPDLTTGYASYGRISGLTFDGPASWDGVTFGLPISDMNGVKISARQRLEDCYIRNFHRGLGVLEDHLQVINCGITSNTYNLALLAGSVGSGDHHYTSVDLSGAAIASIYVENSQGIDASFFFGVHMGVGPYGILSAAGKTGNGFISASTFIDSPIEVFGTAAIWGANATDQIVNSRWIGCGTSQNSGYAPLSMPYEFLVRSGLIRNSVFDAYFIPTTAPGTAYFSASGTGNALDLSEFIYGPRDALEDNNTRFLHRVDGSNPTFCSFSGPSRQGTFCQAATPVTKGHLLRPWGANACRTYVDDTLADVPLGVALQSGVTGETIAVQTEGYTVLLVADGTIAVNRFLKPAATDGRVVAATGWSDGPIVGVALGSATVGNVFEAHLRLGAWG